MCHTRGLTSNFRHVTYNKAIGPAATLSWSFVCSQLTIAPGGSQPLLHVDERKGGRQQVRPVPLHTRIIHTMQPVLQACSLGALQETPLTFSETCMMHLSAHGRCHMCLPSPRPTMCQACAYLSAQQVRLQVAPASDSQDSTKQAGLKSCHSRFVQVSCSPCSRPLIPLAASTGAAQSRSFGTGRPGQAALQ